MNKVRPTLRLNIRDGDPYQYIIQHIIQRGIDETIYLNASLDYVLSDILSFSPIPTTETINGREAIDGGFYIDVEKDPGFAAAIRDSYDYARLKESVDDKPHSEKQFSSLALIQNIHEYMEICSKIPRFMNYESFQTFLAIRQIDEPNGHTVVLFKEGKGVDSRKCYHDWSELHSSHFPEQNCFELFEQNRDSFSIWTTYEFWGYADLALIILSVLLKNGLMLKRCSWCGNWFSPSRIGEQYCTRTAPGEVWKSCKEAAKYEKQLKRERASESGRIYKSVSTMLAARAERKDITRDEVDDFRDEARKWRDLVKRGERTEAEYIKFLNSYKKRPPK